MWAGKSTPSRTRKRSSILLTSLSMKTVLMLFCCIFFVVVDIELVTSMSIERLGIDRSNELQSDKQTSISEQKNSDLVVEDEELEAVPAGGETELYVLLPAGSKAERESVNKNTIESDDIESSIVQENGGDMIMMESQDTPVVQVVNLPPSVNVIEKENEKEIKENVDNKTETETKDEDEDQEEDEPVKQVFKNDKDIEDIDSIDNESDKDTDSNEENLTATQTGDAAKDGSDEEPESMVEMFADVVEEVEKEIENGLMGEETVEGSNKDNKAKDEEQAKWEETVEKLEEKGSEKHKEKEKEAEIEGEAALEAAAAVIEELMPEDVAEAMALTELTDSEEKNDNEKNISKNEDKINEKLTENKKNAEKQQVVQKQDIEHKDSKEQQENFEGTKKDEQDKLEKNDKVENDEKIIAEEEEHKLPIEDQVMEESNIVEEIKPLEIKQEILLADTLETEEHKGESELEADNIKQEIKPLENENETEQQQLENEVEAKPENEMEQQQENEAEQHKESETDLKQQNEAEQHQENETAEHHETEIEKDKDFNKKQVQQTEIELNNIKESNEEHKEVQTEETEKENPEAQEVAAQSEETAEILQEEKEKEEVEPTKEADETKESATGNTGKEEESDLAPMNVAEIQQTNEDLNKESIIMQPDEEPVLIDMDTSDNGNKKVGEAIVNEIIEHESKPLNQANDETQATSIQAQENPLNELIDENENEKTEVDENHSDELTKPQAETLQQENLNENEKKEESLLSPPEPAPQVPEKHEELESTKEKEEANEMTPSTMLTTIIQTPSQELEPPHEQQQQQQEQVEQQQIVIQQDEMPTKDDSNLQNEQIPDAVTVQATIISSTQRPQIVAISAIQDSVLNYVNATNIISQKEQQKLQQQQELTSEIGYNNKTEEDLPFNSQLRRYDGAQVWRIVVQNDRDRRLADELQTKYDGQLWKEVKQEVDYLLKPQILAEAEKHIRAANLSRIVLIDNLQKVIEVENPALDEFVDADNEKGHRLTWQSYHRLADIHDFFDYLAKTYPEICAVETIGYSIEKRPLKVLKISNGNAGNPSVWMDGGMHAREWISPASVTYIANQIAEGWENLPSYMQNINWYIHAVANPDGYEYTHTTDRLWRKNMRSHGRQCPGVDLNRNFGYKWGGKGTSANPCSQTYRGSKAFSEPETFYISKFISNYPRDTFHAFLSFHSYGQYILYPWGYDNAVTNDKSDLDRVGRAAATTITRSSGVKYTVGPSAMTLYPAAGGSDDWAKGIANIKYTYTIEMGDTGRYGFILPANQIESNGKDAYTFVQTVARAISHDMRKRTIKLK